MQHVRLSPIVLVMVLVLFPQPVVGQQRSVDLRGQWGHTYLLEDTPPHAWIGGGSVTAAVGSRLRLGLEVLKANMFGKYSNFKERATLVNPVVEFRILAGAALQSLPGHRRRIYPVSCPRTKCVVLLRFLAPGVRVAQAGEFQSRRGAGCPAVHDQALFRGDGTPHWFDSLATLNRRSRLFFLRERQSRFRSEWNWGPRSNGTKTLCFSVVPRSVKWSVSDAR